MPHDNSSLESARLRVNLGAHEFEAEGPLEEVATHFQTWLWLTIES